MEEMTNTVGTEEVVPQTDSADNATEATTETVEQTTTSEQQNGEVAENPNSDNSEQTGQTGADESAESAPFLMVRYNHENKGLSQTEAQSFAQKGMQAEPLMADLRYLAAQEGAKSVKDFIDSLKTSADNARRENIKNQLVDEGNEELLNSIFTAETAKLLTAAGVIEQNEAKAFADEYDNENTRIADEFLALKAEFPEFKEIKDVPQSVLHIAFKNKISLLDAHLRFQHAENKKIKQAEQSAAAAKISSTGSMGSENTDTSTPALEAMRRGVWQ